MKEWLDEQQNLVLPKSPISETITYSYRISQVYYDWLTRQWRLLPERIAPDTAFSAWIQQLKEMDDVEKLEILAEEIAEALEELEISG